MRIRVGDWDWISEFGSGARVIRIVYKDWGLGIGIGDWGLGIVIGDWG